MLFILNVDLYLYSDNNKQKKEIMKKSIKKTILTINLIYWFVYLIKTFIEWEFKNPYAWILELPNDIDLRIIIFLSLFPIIAFSYLIFSIFEDVKKDKLSNF